MSVTNEGDTNQDKVVTPDPSQTPDAPPAQEPDQQQQDPAPESPKDDASGDAQPPAKDPEKGDVDGVPEKYDLKLPEGSPLDDAGLEAVASFAKEHGLTQTQAQSLLERESAAKAAQAQEAKAALEKQAEAWAKEITADPEIGGEKLEESKELAKRALDKYLPNVAKALAGTAFENFPALFRDAVELGRLMQNDKLVLPGAQNGSRDKTWTEALYGDQGA